MFTEFGNRVRADSESLWGVRGTVHLIGESARLLEAQRRAQRFASIDSPVLITGESGVGKELFARSLYLMSARRGRPFRSVNCAQYQNDELLVSELFGHRKGSFTGAVADHDGLFLSADSGVVFLDEVGELSLQAQAMLLRVLSEGEVRPLGRTETRHVNVRVIAATNRPLPEMVASGRFRSDLYYRLRYLQLAIPPVRERDDDWRLLTSFYLAKAGRKNGQPKRLSPAACNVLAAHPWPGNVRELRSVVEVGYCLSETDVIDAEHLADMLSVASSDTAQGPRVRTDAVQAALLQMAEQEATFWDAVREPFLARDLNRREVREIINRGLHESGWSYKSLLVLFNLAEDEYLRFMDFLRHHRLKPASRRTGLLMHRTQAY